MSLSEFLSGALFSVGLFSSGVYAPTTIASQFNFTSNVMITTMMAASAASAIAMDLADRLGFMQKRHSAPSNLGLFEFDGNVLGGVLIGIGMAATGACPGTTFVQAGTGSVHGILVALGGILGATTFVLVQDRLRNGKTTTASRVARNVPDSPIREKAPRTTLDIATALNISPLALLLIWVPMCLMVVKLAFAQDGSLRERANPGLLPPAQAGMLIGFAQLATILLTNHAIGASGAYEDVAQWLSSLLGTRPRKVFLTGPVAFAMGITCAAALLQYTFYGGVAPDLLDRAFQVTLPAALQSLLGGWVMVLGARIARGCTSGHGISGLSKFSLPSLVSTASLFGAGCAATMAFQSF